jgi:hypothetical protein
VAGSTDTQLHEDTPPGASSPTTSQQTSHQSQRTDPAETDTDPSQPDARLSAYIHRVVDSAPTPTAAQLERLARLLPDTTEANLHSMPQPSSLKLK